MFSPRLSLLVCCLTAAGAALAASGTSVGKVAPYAYTDHRAPSQEPPGGFAPEQCPLFVVMGCDDNQRADGIRWILDLFKGKANPKGTGKRATFDGGPVHASFYFTPGYEEDTNKVVTPEMVEAWRAVRAAGHEIGNHTWMHAHGGAFDVARWKGEMTRCDNFLVSRVGAAREEIIGFRSPYLEYNPAVFDAIREMGMTYDCSVQGGWKDLLGIQGANCFWPYTLDDGRPEGGSDYGPTGRHPGVWEIPVDAFYYPIDIGMTYAKQTGFDWNLWVPDSGQTKDQFVKTLKHNLNLRYNGNRAPLTFGFHPQYYSVERDSTNEESKRLRSRVADRQAALREFVEYALTLPDVRFVSAKELLQWLRKPEKLGTVAKAFAITAESGPHGSISPSGDVLAREGSDRTFTFTPDEYASSSVRYAVADVKVDGASIGKPRSYTFARVTGNHKIEVAFSPAR